MATSSRQTSLFGLQDWKKIYQTYRTADFSSYDYETLRKNFIDYLTQYYPETFNDFTESSEYVALLDVMAFMGQALAFRDDLNTRENFIDTAERRDSVLKLAKLVSYTAKRNNTSSGLVKITAVNTTENLSDINGNNISNTTILWADPANPYWLEQFNTVINAALVNNQRIGRPGNSQTILNVKTDEYSINLPTDVLPVVPYRTEVDSVTMNFELVSATSSGKSALYELPPAPSSVFNVLYRNDNLGYASANTGYFFMFKQGTLLNYDFNFAEGIENNFQQIDIQGINNTDTWLYQTDSSGVITERWTQVDNIYGRSTNQLSGAAPVFSVDSRTNDQVTYIFGDGVFGRIPLGQYRAYLRSSNGLTYTIDPSEMSGITASINYISRYNRVETLTVTFNLQTTVNNAQARESIARIKERAPTQYYTQNRMVNGEDYTNFPYTKYNSIIKSAAVNRSSIGVSRNQDLLDPTGRYSSTNILGTDGALYQNNTSAVAIFSTLSSNIATQFLSQILPEYLSTAAVKQYYLNNCTRWSGVNPSSGIGDANIYWNRSTVIDGQVSGYFYFNGNINQPAPVGQSTTNNLRYVSTGASIKFIAPAGQYFDRNNRLQSGIPNPLNGDKTYIWATPTAVIGDGANYGRGNLANGSGPITLNVYIPSGAILDGNTVTPTGIIPSFDNTLGVDLIRRLLNLIDLKQNFNLYYDNSLSINTERWSTTAVSANSVLMISFQYQSIDATYSVTFKNTTYYIGSVDQVKFLFSGTNRIFDPVTGQILNDFVSVLSSNTSPLTGQILGTNYTLWITGQQTQSDGYPDDYAVSVSAINPNNGYTYDPDIFTVITGTSTSRWVFFRIINNINDNYTAVLLPANAIITAYATESAILTSIYEWSAGTVFYATAENKFYQSVENIEVQPAVLELLDVSTEYYVLTGRSALYFQYRHNSDDTSRIDPATTNIIDLYLVTQAYWTQYQSWLNDTTGSVTQPQQPTIAQLQQEYSDLTQFKMVSDSVILNSVTFKPLFGTKAQPALRGSIKVIKNPYSTASDSAVRSSVLGAMNTYFDLTNWNFGETFYFSELSAYLHSQLGELISSVVLVPADPQQTFGDLYEIKSLPNEIFVNGATVNDIVVISALTPQSLQRRI